MSLSTLRKRLELIERATSPAHPAGLVRIVSESDSDAADQIATLEAAGLHKPGQFVIDRRIVDPQPRRPVA